MTSTQFDSTSDFIEFLKRASEDPSYDADIPVVEERRPVGRPRKTLNPKTINIKVEGEILDEFTRKAHAAGMSQADRVRKLIEDDISAA